MFYVSATAYHTRERQQTGVRKMSRNLCCFLNGNRAGRWAGRFLALGLVVVCLPALAFDEGGVPAVSKSTAEALKSFTGVNGSIVVPAASATIFDETPPIMGTAESPDYVQASSIPVSYSGMTDAASGLKRVTLWVRYGQGGWASTGQSLDTESGTFTFNPNGVEGTYHFHFLLEDRAGNRTPEPSGDGLTSTKVEGAADYTLSMSEDLVGQPGATIPCPVNIGDTQGLTDYNLTVAFDAGLLEVDRVAVGSETGRLGWSRPAVTVGSGSVSLAASGHALRGGQGSIAVIYFTVKEAENGNTAPLSFASATLNGGGATVNTRDGLFTLDNESFVWGDVNGDGDVDNEDSTIVLNHRTGLARGRQKSADSEAEEVRFFLAGNVAGDDPPRLGTVDASLIMRHTAGAISRFPVDRRGTGRGPQIPTDEAAVKAAVFEEYGDPTETPRLISMPGEVTLEPGVTFQVPVSVDMADGMRGYYFELVYDYRALELVNVSSGSLTKEWILPIVNPLTGKINVVGAHTEPASGEGTLALLTFRALSGVTPGATTRLGFEDVELNDGLLVSQVSTGMGEPVITAIEPSTGAESGGTVVRITGVNLGDVSRVVFGGLESPWVNADRAEGVVYALTPIGGGTVDVTVESPAGAGTLTEGFNFFIPQVHLTLAPEQAVESGNRFDVPVWIVDLTGGEVSTVTFDLCFDPRVFTPIRTDGALVTAEDSALAAGKSVTATLAAPGRLRVTVDGAAAQGIPSGLLATCHLLAIAAEEEAQTLIYITDTVAEGPNAKSLPASASFMLE